MNKLKLSPSPDLNSKRKQLEKKNIQAAKKYVQFLKENPKEKKWIKEWEKARLQHPPQKSSR